MKGSDGGKVANMYTSHFQEEGKTGVAKDGKEDKYRSCSSHVQKERREETRESDRGKIVLMYTSHVQEGVKTG